MAKRDYILHNFWWKLTSFLLAIIVWIVVPAAARPNLNPACEVLMIRTHKWADLWGIPGGKIKWGETAEDALRREVREETALEITNIQFALVQDCIRSKEFYREAHFVLLNYTCETPGGDVILNDEAEAFQWLPPHAALSLELNTP